MLAIAGLYLYGLSRVGVLDPDEPRYLSIGRAMVQTGDYITPHLWGSPWFEKPPLLYWMTSLGTFAGLGPELSGRLPIALLSLSFLVAMFVLLRLEFGTHAAAVSTVLLSTSAGWLPYSSLALTDLPMAAFFSLAVFLSLPLVRVQPGAMGRHTVRFLLIGMCLGFAALAKGLVPLALALPFAWFLRRWWKSWPVAIASVMFIALPWYVAVYLQNGNAFLQEFFWKHHFERLYSPTLQHVQPWYYYGPILLAAIFPWTPLVGLFTIRSRNWDQRRFFLAACFAFGLILFSISLNKLPGYILPLLPAGFALLAASVEWDRFTQSQRLWLLPCAVLVGLLPLVSQALPDTLGAGRLTLPHHLNVGRTTLFYIVAPVAAILLGRRSWTGILLVLCLVAGALFLKIVSFPILDRSVSPRGVWRQIKNTPGTVCDEWLDRYWQYGLAFYRGDPYPACDSGKFTFHLRSRGRGRPILERAVP